MKTSKWWVIGGILALAILVFGAVGWAATINVPGDYATIQAAIDAASSGDTILVAAGTYNERIAMKDGITVEGAGPGVSIIDGTDLAPPVGTPNQYGVINFKDIEGNAAIKGFSIRHRGTTSSPWSNYGIDMRGPLHAVSGLITVENNHISAVRGKGINIWGGYQNVQIKNNVIAYDGHPQVETPGVGPEEGINVCWGATVNIINNVVYGWSSGIRSNQWKPSPTVNVKNTIVSNCDTGLLVYKFTQSPPSISYSSFWNIAGAYPDCWFGTCGQGCENFPSCVEFGEGNLFDPDGSTPVGGAMFVNPTDDPLTWNFYLQDGSPSIGTGENGMDMGLIPPPPPSEVWVDDNYDETTPGWGYDHFNKIQDGIDAVAGSTVNVAAGAYTENVEVNKQVTIIGAGAANTIVTAAANTDHVFEVTADGVSISALTATGANKASYSYREKSGIYIDDADGCTIDSVIAADNNIGIFLDHSDGSTVTGCTATNNIRFGIYLEWSDGNELSNNDASSNGQDGSWASTQSPGQIGIYLKWSNNNELIGNTANSNIGGESTWGSSGSESGIGIAVWAGASNVLTGNTANDNESLGNSFNTGIGIYLYQASGTASDHTVLTGNTANGNKFKVGTTARIKSGSGIVLYQTHYADVTGNTVNSNQQNGLYSEGAIGNFVHDNVVTGTTATGNQIGFYLVNDASTYTDNTITGNTDGVRSDSYGGMQVTATTLHYNNISGNGNYGANNIGTDPLNAEKNWWGHVTGADPDTEANNPHGAAAAGDKVTDNVDFTPWYATATTTPLTENVSVEHPGSSIIAYSDTIQGGIDAALAGDTINVAAGTYVEHLDIDKNDLTLAGAGRDAGGTLIMSPDTLESKFYYVGEFGEFDVGPIVYVHGATGVTIEQLAIDGTECTSPLEVTGVFYHNAGGVVNHCKVVPQNIGVLAVNDDGTSRILNVTDNLIFDYDENGILLFGENLTVDVTGNDVTGRGGVEYTCSVGILGTDGVTGDFSGNVCSGHHYTGEEMWPFGEPVRAFGILLHGNTGTVTCSENEVYDNDMGIVFWGDWGTTGEFSNNTVYGNNSGMEFWGITGNYMVTGNTIRDNNGSGIYVNTVPEGSYINGNNIYGNGNGIANDSGDMLDATDNWWGYATGPYHPMENPGGQGNRVSDNVDFDPWRTDPNIPTSQFVSSCDFPFDGWNLVSVPLAPMDPANGDSVFGDDVAGSLDDRLYRYNVPEHPDCYTAGGDLAVKPEYGFWLYLTNPTIIDVAGGDCTCDYETVEFADGWQQISTPFSTYWKDTMVSNDGGDNWISLADAVTTNSWLDNAIHQWDAEHQWYETISYSVTDHAAWDLLYLKPWNGYWIKNKSGGDLKFKFIYATPPTPTAYSTMAEEQAALWRPLSELEGVSRPPAPPMLPQAAAIAQNIAVAVAPNPVQQGTAVEFRVTGEMASFVSSVTVQVYTVGGQLVFDESTQGQTVTWNLRTLSGEPVANGLYLYVAQMEFIGGETAKFNKLLILK